MGVEDLKHFQLGAAKLSKATLDSIVDAALAYMRGAHGLHLRQQTPLVKLSAQIAAQATGSAQAVAWDADSSAWAAFGDAFTVFNIGPGTAPADAVVPLISGHTDLPTFQYFAGGAVADESSSSTPSASSVSSSSSTDPSASSSSSSTTSSSTSGQHSSSSSSSTEGNPTSIGAETVVMLNANAGIYDGNTELLSITVTRNGGYLIAGAMSCEPKSAGSVSLYIFKNDDMAALPGCTATHDPAGSYDLDHLGIPTTNVVLSAGDEIKLVGYAFGGTPGNGATVDGTFLTVVGPLI